jgi:hypothetical protein
MMTIKDPINLLFPTLDMLLDHFFSLESMYFSLGNGITNVVVGSGEGVVSDFDPKA